MGLKRIYSTEMKMKNCLDNASLIERYVQGEMTLAANLNLRVETTDDRIQLLESNGKLLAIKDLKAHTPTFLVRHNSDFSVLIQQALQNNAFAPDSGIDTIRLVRYRQHSVPSNYRLKFDEAGVLWKRWWLHNQNSRNTRLQLDFLLMMRQKWYPLQSIFCDRGTFFIKTLIGEVVLHRTDIAIWLERNDTAAADSINQGWFASPQKGVFL